MKTIIKIIALLLLVSCNNIKESENIINKYDTIKPDSIILTNFQSYGWTYYYKSDTIKIKDTSIYYDTGYTILRSDTLFMVFREIEIEFFDEYFYDPIIKKQRLIKHRYVDTIIHIENYKQ